RKSGCCRCFSRRFSGPRASVRSPTRRRKAKRMRRQCVSWVFLRGAKRHVALERRACTSGPRRARIRPQAVPGGPMSLSDAVSMGIGPLATMGEDALKALAPHGSARSYPKNSVIINEGDETDSLYVLLAGRVKVFVSDEEGKEVVLSTMREGSYFGELVLDGGPRSASVMALEPCRCFVIPMSEI